LTRALLSEPDVLILSEPTAFASSTQRAHIFRLLSKWQRSAPRLGAHESWPGVMRTVLVDTMMADDIVSLPGVDGAPCSLCAHLAGQI
jgi:hypothetical protein